MLLSSILSVLSYVEANSGNEVSRRIWNHLLIIMASHMYLAWATLPMNVAPYLTENAYIPSTVPALVGTPPQQMNLM